MGLEVSVEHVETIKAQEEGGYDPLRPSPSQLEQVLGPPAGRLDALCLGDLGGGGPRRQAELTRGCAYFSVFASAAACPGQSR